MDANPSLSGVLPQTYTDLGNELLRNVLRIFNNPQLTKKATTSSDASTSTSSKVRRRSRATTGVLHSQVPVRTS